MWAPPFVLSVASVQSVVSSAAWFRLRHAIHLGYGHRAIPPRFNSHLDDDEDEEKGASQIKSAALLVLAKPSLMQPQTDCAVWSLGLARGRGLVK